MEERLFKKAQEAFSEHLVAPDNKTFFGSKAEVEVGNIFAEYFYVFGFCVAEVHLVTHSNVRDLHRVVAHHFCCYCIDSNGVGACEDEVFYFGEHCSGSCSVTADGGVHYGEDSGMNFFLHNNQLDEYFVDIFVGVVADLLKESSEGIFDCACGLRVAVRF